MSGLKKRMSDGACTICPGAVVICRVPRHFGGSRGSRPATNGGHHELDRDPESDPNPDDRCCARDRRDTRMAERAWLAGHLCQGGAHRAGRRLLPIMVARWAFNGGTALAVVLGLS